MLALVCTAAPFTSSGARSACSIRCTAARSELGILADVGEQQQELIAPLTHQRVTRADGVGQAVSHLAQQLVSGAVAETVVDRLEVVEVEVHERYREVLAAAAFERVVEQCPQAPSIGQTREGVVVGEVGHLVLGVSALADVVLHADELHDVPVAAHGRQENGVPLLAAARARWSTRSEARSSSRRRDASTFPPSAVACGVARRSRAAEGIRGPRSGFGARLAQSPWTAALL